MKNAKKSSECQLAGWKERKRGNESRGEEQKVQEEDDGKGTPCPAPSREEKQEAATERDTAKTQLLNRSQETAAKCEVLLLLHVPQTSNPHTALSPPWHSAQRQPRQLSS